MAKTILVIEHNKLHLKLFNDILQANSFNTVLTSDERKAIELAKAHYPDLIIMGIRMPSLSDLDTTKLIKSEDDLKEIPIIAVTALTMKDDERNICDSGCDAYIKKPISVVPFIKTIQDFLR
ncbi:MAG: two-component system response regulator [Magnetovibrio sp.]|nr:two-component system response regulator [Magnetovibrio sp.]